MGSAVCSLFWAGAQCAQGAEVHLEMALCGACFQSMTFAECLLPIMLQNKELGAY